MTLKEEKWVVLKGKGQNDTPWQTPTFPPRPFFDSPCSLPKNFNFSLHKGRAPWLLPLFRWPRHSRPLYPSFPVFFSYAGVNDPVTRSRRFLPLFRPLQGCRAHHLPFVLFVLFLLSPSINTLPQKERCGNPDVCPTLIHAHSALYFLGQYINDLQPN